MDIRPLTPTEQKYTYAQSMQLEGQTGTIGHLRGDFATTGYGFYTTWFDTRPQWKSDEFKADLDTVINALREDKGLLHNRYDMSAFARHFPESAIKNIQFDTLTEQAEYEIVAVFKTVAYSSEGFRYYDFVDAENEEDFNSYIGKCKELALYDTGVTAEYGDRLITLSTCEYSARNGRLVVVAKMVG